MSKKDIKASQIKLLWGKSQGKCAICKVNLIKFSQEGKDFQVGVMAHIEGENLSSARYNENMTDAERGVYDNLILVCPTHHAEIDKDLCQYSVEKLRQIKKNHEKWVEDSLSSKTVGNRLTWLNFQNCCSSLSKINIDRIVSEKDAATIIPNIISRKESLRIVNDFLNSNATFLVIVGESGMGKTCFLFEIMNFFQHRSDVASIIYKADEFKPKNTIADKINKDLNNNADFNKNKILANINKNTEFEGKLFIIIIDAVNTNIAPLNLIEQINDLNKYNYRRTKIILTCRPHIWKQARSFGKISPSYYYKPNNIDQNFLELSKFSNEEASQAYKKYKNIFKLKSPSEFGLLVPRLREQLHDPLLLKLLSEIYCGKNLPGEISGLDINVVPEYIDHLICNNYLDKKDISFLETFVNPMMMVMERFIDTISQDEITKIKNMDNKKHLENLISSGILTEFCSDSGKQSDILIKYRFERFQEYFFAKYIQDNFAKLNDGNLNSTVVYQNYIIKCKEEYLFMWGVIQNVLLFECKSQNTKLIRELCFTDIEIVKEMMASILISFSHERREYVIMLIKQIIEESNFSKKERTKYLNACRIAIGVASSIGASNVLYLAMKHKLKEVRLEGVRYTFYLWLKNSSDGYEALEELKKYIINSSIFDFISAFESCLGLSLLILFYANKRSKNKHKNSSSTDLFRIWKEIISRILDYRPRGIFRQVILIIIKKIVINLLSENPRYNVLNPEEFKYFFKLSDIEKASYKRLVHFLVSDHFDIEEVKTEMINAIRRNDTLSSFVMGQILIKHGLKQPKNVLKLIKYLWDAAINIAPIGFAMGQIPFVLYKIQRYQNKFDPKIFKILEKYGSDFLDRTKGKHQNQNNSYVAIFLNLHAICQYEISKEVKRNDLIANYLKRAIEAKDTEFILDILWHLGTLRHEELYYRLLLENIKPLLNFENEAIKNEIINILARMHYYRPDNIDEYMIDQRLPEMFIKQVHQRGLKESIGGDLIWSSVIFGFGDLFIDIFNDTELSNHFIDVFLKASELRSMNDWILYCAKSVANLFCDTPIFKTK